MRRLADDGWYVGILPVAFLSVGVFGLISARGAIEMQRDAVPVRVSPAAELYPVAGGRYEAWSQNRRGYRRDFDAYARVGEKRPFRVNRPGTHARPGSIDGTTLVFQEWRGSRSDLRFFNLKQRKRLPTPPGVNTRQWETGGSLSARRLAFVRISRRKHLARLVVRFLRSRKQRVILTRRYPKFRVTVGQLNGRYLVATVCGPRCTIAGYDVQTMKGLKLPQSLIPETQDFAPSVTADGTVYFARVFTIDRCGNDATHLLRVRRSEDEATTIGQVSPEQSVGSTYAASRAGQTNVFYSVGVCGPNPDIYRLIDPG